MRYLVVFLLLMMLGSCGSDDDICVSGEATPRMKILFKKASDGKLTRLDRIIVDADYGSGLTNVVNQISADSVLVPLKVDRSSYTDLYIRTSASGDTARVRVNYSGEAQYVSPACGFKKLYREISVDLQKANPVSATELVQKEIINEDYVHLYLLF
ncbi:DUF6452 family protein [Bergeyella sp. RCAD1439]|uniref:DUF6452 family protein n=1 Tax=Bergeyella anatis TaxID=3113737 RepID=UPI002E1793EF|nr:DUF6452 family protein [Bergeyella sp. RCAD1439]